MRRYAQSQDQQGRVIGSIAHQPVGELGKEVGHLAREVREERDQLKGREPYRVNPVRPKRDAREDGGNGNVHYEMPDVDRPVSGAVCHQKMVHGVAEGHREDRRRTYLFRTGSPAQRSRTEKANRDKIDDQKRVHRMVVSLLPGGVKDQAAA